MLSWVQLTVVCKSLLHVAAALVCMCCLHVEAKASENNTSDICAVMLLYSRCCTTLYPGMVWQTGVSHAYIGKLVVAMLLECTHSMQHGSE